MGHNLIVQGLKLALAPVHLGLAFDARQVSADEAYHAGCVHIGHSVPVAIVDRVACGHLFASLDGQADVGCNALPPVEYVQALKAARIDHIQVKRLGQIVLPLDEDKPSSAAVQPAPAQALIEAFTQPDAAFQLVQRRQGVRRYAFDRVPLAQHIIDHKSDDVLHYPIPTIQGVEQRIVVRHTGERVFRRLKRRLAAVP